MKKFLSLALAIACIATLLVVPMQVMAADEPEVIAFMSKPMETLTTTSGKPTSTLNFVYASYTSVGYDCAWGLGIADAEGNVATWYNPNNDADVILNGETKQTAFGQSWCDSWANNADGKMQATFIWQIPEDVLAAAGYETMYAAAQAGVLKAFMAEYNESHANDGSIKGDFTANGTINDKDALILTVAAEGAEEDDDDSDDDSDNDSVALPEDGTISDPWVLVDDSDTDVVKAFNADDSLIDTQAIFDAGVNDVTSEGAQFKFFMGSGVGHLINNTSTNINGAQGAYVEFTFTGTAVALLSQFHEVKANCANLEFFIDGESKGTLAGTDYGCVTMDGSHTDRKVYFQISGLEAGEHVLKVMSTSAGQATIDAFAYIPAEVDDEEAAPTGDAMIATIAIAAAAAAGAVLVIGKKRA